MKTAHKVYADLPQSGLGNLLLIWARARVFSHVNGIPLVTSRWWGIRPGAWWRRESRKRTYWGYFRESPWWERMEMKYRLWGSTVVNEPPVEKIDLPEGPAIFRFGDPVVHNDLFKGVKPYREFIREELHRLLQPKLQKQVAQLPRPEIAVHIRRGDFKIASTLTPTDFFVRCIEFIRRETKQPLAVTVFTDAENHEIADILGMENVSLAAKKPDILDIIQMSRSRILVLSQTSTFSYWAAFLSNGLILKPWGDWYNDVRPEEVNENSFEGRIRFEPAESLAPLRKALAREFCREAGTSPLDMPVAKGNKPLERL